MTTCGLRAVCHMRPRSKRPVSLNHLPNSGNALSRWAKGCNQPPENVKTRMGELGGNVRISANSANPDSARFAKTNPVGISEGLMSLQPRPNNSDDLEALEPIDLLPVQGTQTVLPYFAQQQNPILHYWQILKKRKWVVLDRKSTRLNSSHLGTSSARRLRDVPTRRSSDLVQGTQTVLPYFAQQQNPILHYWQILKKRKWVV